VFLQGDVVTPRGGDHLLMVDICQARDLPNCSYVTTELISMNDLWDIVFPQQSGQEGLRCLSVSVPLKENVEHETVLIYSPPQPMSNTIALVQTSSRYHLERGRGSR
jgi:hypothetical protein